MNFLSKYLLKPVRFDYLDKWLKRDGVKILDVGCGVRASIMTKLYYPKCKFFGIDITDEGFEKGNIKNMEKFYMIDIRKDDLSKIPNNYFDCIILSHILEHIKNGEEIIRKLLPKLMRGGIIYIETPSIKSTKLPSMKGTLNFYDEPTHVRIYSLNLLIDLLKENKCSIIKAGTRRSVKRILLFPIYFIGTALFRGGLTATAFWDISGFAKYVIAKKEM